MSSNLSQPVLKPSDDSHGALVQGAYNRKVTARLIYEPHSEDF